MADKQKLIQERRNQLPMEQRQVEALEQIADTLGRIQGELAAIRASMGPGRSSY